MKPNVRQLLLSKTRIDISSISPKPILSLPRYCTKQPPIYILYYIKNEKGNEWSDLYVEVLPLQIATMGKAVYFCSRKMHTADSYFSIDTYLIFSNDPGCVFIRYFSRYFCCLLFRMDLAF